MFLTIFCAFVIGIVGFIYFYVHHKLQYWKNRNVPHVEPEFFYGNTRGIGKEYHSNEFIQRMYFKLKPLGPIGGVYMFLRTMAFVTDLDLVKNILVKDFKIFTNRGHYFNEEDDPLSAHLVGVEDETWKQLRQKITPSFSSGKLRMMFATVSGVADKLVETIQKETETSGQLEVKDIFGRFTTDVIGSTAFGIECNSLADKSTKFYQMGLKALSSIKLVKRAFLMTYRELGRKLHMTTTTKEVEDFYMDVVKSTLKYREENPNIQRNDFMDLLIKLKISGSLTVNQIAAQSFIFILAGKFYVITFHSIDIFSLKDTKQVQQL